MPAGHKIDDRALPAEDSGQLGPARRIHNSCHGPQIALRDRFWSVPVFGLEILMFEAGKRESDSRRRCVGMQVEDAEPRELVR
jgi:hypothetical protein